MSNQAKTKIKEGEKFNSWVVDAISACWMTHFLFMLNLSVSYRSVQFFILQQKRKSTKSKRVVNHFCLLVSMERKLQQSELTEIEIKGKLIRSTCS